MQIKLFKTIEDGFIFKVTGDCCGFLILAEDEVEQFLDLLGDYLV